MKIFGVILSPLYFVISLVVRLLAVINLLSVGRKEQEYSGRYLEEEGSPAEAVAPGKEPVLSAYDHRLFDRHGWENGEGYQHEDRWE